LKPKLTWTETAAAYITKGEYRYFSPIFHVQKSDGLLVSVHSLALTNAPRTNHLQPILAKLEGEFKRQEETAASRITEEVLHCARLLDVDIEDLKTYGGLQ